MSTGKIIGGVLIGVGAIAAAPFTGGGSLFAAGVSLSAALGGSAAIGAAVGAGALGGAAGAGIAYKEKQDNRKANDNHFKEGMKSGSNRTKQKFSTILKTQKERDKLMLLSIKIGVYVSKIDGHIDPRELAEIEKLSLFINHNPTTPEFIKKEVQKIIKSDISFKEIHDDMDDFLKDKSKPYIKKTINFYTKLIETIINADKKAHPQEEEFLKNWKSQFQN
jgi:uncharacterized membrane protein YebE (DUF533 family)